MELDDKKAIALFRVGVLGPLVSARLAHGDRQMYFEQAAARAHVHPDGRVIKLTASTTEAWYLAHRRGGFEALMPRTRSDKQRNRAVPPELCELLVRAKREKPRRSIRKLIAMLERAGKVPRGKLTHSTVHRVLAAAGVSARPTRADVENGAGGDIVERRSFILEHAGDLWVGDAMHGPRVIAPDGRLRKAYLLSQIDCATRYVIHSYVTLSEDAPAQEYGLKQALLTHGLARAYYVDRGAAYIAGSLKMICAELRIRLRHTGPGDCEAKGVIEAWHRRWRAEVGDELPDKPFALAELNAIHWAWLGSDYHVTRHETTEREPQEHFLSEVSEPRSLPRDKDLDEVFLHRDKRDVRKDGTVRWKGGFLEVRPELVGKKKIELRFDPVDDDALPRVFIDDRFYCDTTRLDRLANGSRVRRRIVSAPAAPIVPSGLDPLGDLVREHYGRTRLSGADEDNERGPVPRPRTTRRDPS